MSSGRFIDWLVSYFIVGRLIDSLSIYSTTDWLTWCVLSVPYTRLQQHVTDALSRDRGLDNPHHHHPHHHHHHHHHHQCQSSQSNVMLAASDTLWWIWNCNKRCSSRIFQLVDSMNRWVLQQTGSNRNFMHYFRFAPIGSALSATIMQFPPLSGTRLNLSVESDYTWMIGVILISWARTQATDYTHWPVNLCCF